MSDTGIFCSGTEVGYKAGAKASGVPLSEAYTNSYIAQVESFINARCRYNFSDNYAALDTDTKQLLKMVASDLAAIYVISYDMSGWNYDRIEAEDMINILRDRASEGLAILKDKKVVDFVRGAT